MREGPAFIFDLDGTLVDNVYQHVLAWNDAFVLSGVELAIWRIHRKIGMSGGLCVPALLREIGHPLDDVLLTRLQELHTEAYQRRAPEVRPLPGTQRLLAYLTQQDIPWAIATSSNLASAMATLALLDIPEGTPVVTHNLVLHAKPAPDLFLEAVRRLGVDLFRTIVVGDSVWDLLAARRAHMLGVRLLSGGYSADELERAGAYRVYNDPVDLYVHLDEMGVLSSVLAQ